MKEEKLCTNCKSNMVKYCDGYVHRDWSGTFAGDPKDLPEIPDSSVFWTYMECKKNSKGLKYLNLTLDCQGFESVNRK